jgi:hypothetical protein
MHPTNRFEPPIFQVSASAKALQKALSEHSPSSASQSDKARQISSPRRRRKLHSIPPLPLATPATYRPRCRSSACVHGTRAKPRPLSIIANRPEGQHEALAIGAGDHLAAGGRHVEKPGLG